MLRVVLLSMAVSSGGVAAWLAGSGLQDAPTPIATSSFQTQEVLVAAADLEQGATLLPEHMRWQTWPAEAVQNGFITRSAEASEPGSLSGSLIRARLVAGTPILADSIAPANSSFLSAVLSEGMRAVAIRVSAEKTAGGFILPNDRVDVLLAISCLPNDGCNRAMNVQTILTNVRVLAIDQSGGESGSEGVLIGKTATLELNPKQVEMIVGAEATGVLSLVLRAAADRGVTQELTTEQNRVVRVRRDGVVEYVTIR